MTKVIKALTNWPVMLGLQAVASALFAYVIYNLGVLPPMYLYGLIGVFALLLIVSFFLMKPSKEEGKGKVRGVVGKLISVLLSIAMLIGSFYVVQSDNLLEDISGATEQTNRYTLYVLKDSEYKVINDFQFLTIGMSSAYGKEEHYTEAHNVIFYGNPNIRFKDYADYEEMVNDFYNGDIAAIYVDEAYNGVIEEYKETFLEDVRSWYSYEITEQILDISKSVNVTNSVFTIYLSGIDTTGKVSTVSRSDVNMIVTINPVTKDILMTSIPRDYYVTLANKDQKDKLTHAGLGGVENSVKTIENFMGIDINYYARVNFTSVIKIVDALGGVTVNSPVAFTTRVGNYYISKGNNKLNGEKALAFVRERYHLSSGDDDRVRNQQRLLKAMLDKATSPSIITKLSKVLESVKGAFETNMTSDEMLQLIQMQLTDMASWNFYSVVLTGTGKSMTGGAYIPNVKLYYKIPDENSIAHAKGLIDKMTNGEVLTEEDFVIEDEETN